MIKTRANNKHDWHAQWANWKLMQVTTTKQ
jgi:hypothetical protein